MVQRLTPTSLAADSPKLNIALDPQVAAEIATNLPARALVQMVTFPSPSYTRCSLSNHSAG
jgi:hypothetical protein